MVTAHEKKPLQIKGVKLLHKEIQTLLQRPIPGIEIIANESDLFTLVAVLVGPDDSPYEGGRFQIKLVFVDEYPSVPPKGQFVTTIFHPNVAPGSGDICVSTLQKDWRPDLGLAHLLLGKTIKSLLMTPNPESALNEAAGKMLLEDYDGFRSHAALLTRIHASGPAKVENSCGLEKPMSCKSESATLGKNPPPSAVNSLNEARKKLRRL